MMNLGSFSVSLAVKDIAASRDFYAKLGFEEIGGSADDNWLILRNGDHVIGLFHGMFDKNMLTFNPGWDQQCADLESFTDVRDLQKQLIAAGIEMAAEADEGSEGPASIMIIDPDGNPILVDQHR
jgi:catechol 2,3-dioxygenase-like lactoylglutathione lyase family enzyme